MRTIKILLQIVFLTIITGCVEELDIDIPASDLGRIVIEGEITDEEPPYFFRISKTAKLNNPYNPGVKDALVILEDNEGTKDTLQYIKAELVDLWDEGRYFSGFSYKNNYANRNDTITLGWVSDKDYVEGFYVTNKIVGKQNNVYTLSVKHNNITYLATEKMPQKTEIDSLWLDWKATEKENSQIFPFINFQNNQDIDNYYLFSFRRAGLLDMLQQQDYRIWPFSVIDDEHLPESVIAFTPNDGEGLRGYEDFWFHFGDTATVRLGSISKSCYDFYKDLVQQMRYDGGAYTPVPTTGRSNFSNGALGFFRVISVSEKRVKNEYY
jgi:hypothetical protein